MYCASCTTTCICLSIFQRTLSFGACQRFNPESGCKGKDFPRTNQMFSQLFLEKQHYFRISQQTKGHSEDNTLFYIKRQENTKPKIPKWLFQPERGTRKTNQTKKHGCFFQSKKTRKTNQTKKRRCFFQSKKTRKINQTKGAKVKKKDFALNQPH